MKVSSFEVEWYGRLLRIIFRGPRRFIIGKTGKFYYLHLYFIGFAFRKAL